MPGEHERGCTVARQGEAKAKAISVDARNLDLSLYFEHFSEFRTWLRVRQGALALIGVRRNRSRDKRTRTSLLND
jgi:hypothetical protein